MELRDLSYFLACVEAGSVTRAARAVHVAQPTLSHALARLESELGVRLLERGARAPLQVTEADSSSRIALDKRLARCQRCTTTWPASPPARAVSCACARCRALA